MAERVAEPLETLLTPGNRFRLSPLMEATQLLVLVGSAPDDRRRVESIRPILSTERGRRALRELARTDDEFAHSGKPFSRQDISRASLLHLSLASYTTVNVPKLRGWT